MKGDWSVYEERLRASCHQLLAEQKVKLTLGDFDRFASQIFMGLLEKELLRFDPPLLAAEIMAFWLFVNNQKAKVMRVHLRAGMQGGSSATTCIEILGEETPFLLNTLKLHLHRAGLTPLLIIDQPLGHASGGRYRVALQIHVESLSADAGEQLRERLQRAMDELQTIVVDFGPMREVLIRESMLALRFVEVEHDKDENLEFYAFVSWLLQENLLILGVGQWSIVNGERQALLGELLGWPRAVADLDCFGATQLFSSPVQRVAFAQVPLTSPINHDEFCDLVVLRRFDEHKQPVAEIRIVGLYTSRMLQSDPNTIPVLRDKLASLRNLCGFHSLSADARNLERILRFLPRTRLLMASAADLAPTIRDMVLQRRPRQNKFIWWSANFAPMVYLTMFVPKQMYRDRLGDEYLQLFSEWLQIETIRFDIMVSSYLWVRLDFRCALRVMPSLEQKQEIEKRCDALSRNWAQELLLLLEADACCSSAIGQEAALLNWSPEFQEHHSPQDALQVCHLVVRLLSDAAVRVALSNAQEAAMQPALLTVRVVRFDAAIWLSDLFPVMEGFGCRVYKEQSYPLELRGRKIYLHELQVATATVVDPLQFAELEKHIQDCLRHREVVDGFNRLMLISGMTGLRVQMFRAYAAYQQQLGWLPLSRQIADVLTQHPAAVLLLWRLFAGRFDPDGKNDPEGKKTADDAVVLERELNQYLAGVQLRSDDTVLRRYVALMQATVRTNFFSLKHQEKSVLALKLEPQRLDAVPLPRPWREIFVFAHDFEGLHLRFGAIARGGIRWSDRPEDFRTEILGLVKAQQVKNAVIIPVGAKGGFVLHDQRLSAGSEAWRTAGTQAYDAFINALLSLTDNQRSGDIVIDPRIVRYEADDAYLVVAADKGTASFSDRANALSEFRQFWLGDAFASGGKNGYDHKVLGITARGAFLSLSRHLWFLGQNTQEFTCVGIGDMSGDVFGNGMLLAPQMRLLGAFNHAHIFIDPAPEVAIAFAERQRLFSLPRSGWMDYNPRCLSAGGGIYSRAEKLIEVSAEAQVALDIPAGPLTPDALIAALLRAKVDVIWNGGIGTYVKSVRESNAEVGDRANDALRVNGRELRAKIFCEGGNLGMTQRGRVEFSLNGGLCHTDFIDNSAGVDCSDREVNIKIALQGLVQSGAMPVAERNRLLASLQGEVTERVLYDNRQQAFVLAVAVHQQTVRHNEYADFVTFLEAESGLDRQLEGLPEARAWQQRLSQQQWLTRPELAVLLAYAKNDLKQRLTTLALADDLECRNDLLRAFTPTLVAQFRELLLQHPLRQALAGTELANDFIHKLGITSMQRLKQRSGVSLLDQVRAFVRMRTLFELDALWGQIQEDTQLKRQELLEVADQIMRLSRLIVLWWTGEKDLQVKAETLAQILDNLLENTTPLQAFFSGNPTLQQRIRRLEQGVVLLECALIAQLAATTLAQATASYLQVESEVGFDALRQHLLARPVLNAWQAHANESFIEQWRAMQRFLCLRELQGQPIRKSAGLGEWQGLLRRLTPSDYIDTSLYAVLTQKLQVLLGAQTMPLT